MVLIEYAGGKIAPLDTEAGGMDLAARVRHHRIDLVVLDTTPRAVQGGENDADTWTAF